jgi:UDP-N-acetylglucosamine acyltransferase
MPRIHQTAFVHPSARIGSDVEIGPYCFVGPQVEIGDRCLLHPRVVVTGLTTLGAECQVFSGAAVGHHPQDTKYRGEETSLVIGEGTVIREFVTLNRGTESGRKVTKVGTHCVLLPSSHVAHDCSLGDYVTLGVGVKLAGHVTVGDYATFGSLSAVHQHVRIGAYAATSDRSGIPADLIPFGVASGDDRAASLTGLNLAELQRQGFPEEQVHELRQAYRLLFAQEGTLRERLADMVKMFESNPLVRRVIDFIERDTNRQFCVPGEASTFGNGGRLPEARGEVRGQEKGPGRAGERWLRGLATILICSFGF